MQLPIDIILVISEYLKFLDILKLCQTNKYYHRILNKINFQTKNVIYINYKTSYYYINSNLYPIHKITMFMNILKKQINTIYNNDKNYDINKLTDQNIINNILHKNNNCVQYDYYHTPYKFCIKKNYIDEHYLFFQWTSHKYAFININDNDNIDAIKDLIYAISYFSNELIIKYYNMNYLISESEYNIHYIIGKAYIIKYNNIIYQHLYSITNLKIDNINLYKLNY